MTKWTMLGWTLLGLGFAFVFGSLGFMVWMLSDLGYHKGAAMIVIIVGVFMYDQVHDYEDLPQGK